MFDVNSVYSSAAIEKYKYELYKLKVGDEVSPGVTVKEAMISFFCDNVNTPWYFESSLLLDG